MPTTASSAPATPSPSTQTQVSTRWVTPALLADLRGARAELRADFPDLKQEVKMEIRTAMGGGNTRMDAMGAEIQEIKASNQELNGRMDQVYQLLPPARQ
ncbi:MAG: hypothetical protein OXG70_03470 [Cyanobacteria bacterium MAG IRC1_bin_28]|nr:hypothetical protein [Cyanobacteria bacterium MAG IRC3_bin_20]MCY3654082.1 hypothetical protein [Cyanobacteria bacterium MAG IRC1_bin_28]MDE0647996.1 hypothetical protein [Cyanobacteria bacterium MAG IRC4_bin_6]MXX08079.1 hypothetical protein [Synechococcus sp. SB0667_bin_8]MYG64971.1 hypothetical protein [Synechococcus sp. SB0675_bin_7]MYK85628.1 hypothetical protein [Synechococcus sp. SB0669_bin_7]